MIKLEHWVPMTLTYLGDVSSLLRTAGGKLSTPGADTDAPRKPKGLG
jgi:hypothetical protein